MNPGPVDRWSRDKKHIVLLGPTQYVLKIPPPLDAAVSLVPVQFEFSVELVSMKDNEKKKNEIDIEWPYSSAQVCIYLHQ